MSHFDAFAEYQSVIARDTGLASASAEVLVITKAVTKFVGRMVEVVQTGNGSVTCHIARKKYQKTTWEQAEFDTD